MQNTWNVKALEAWLTGALIQNDRIAGHADLIARCARHAAMLLGTAPWLADVPEPIFLAYVLMPRVNDEMLTDHRAQVFESLWPRVRGLPMREAALEANIWCCERATYESTDARTAAPDTVLRRARGRCGEESTFLCCALRAVGIPARQCYAWHWAHCDDNHAWVEAYVDGGWHYMGGCEPEPVLDSGWFTAAASKAMLIRTRSFGISQPGEEVIERLDRYDVINRTAAYAKTRRLTVTVTRGGIPVPGARVIFQLINMAAAQTLCEQIADARGEAGMTAGLGDVLVRAVDGSSVIERVVDVRETDRAAFDLDDAAQTEAARAFDLRPPRETRMEKPAHGAAFAARLAECERLRGEIEARFAAEPALLKEARGNREQIAAFLADARFEMDDKRDLLEVFPVKDLADLTRDALCAMLSEALPAKEQLPREVWLRCVACPRAAWESPLSARADILAFFAARGLRFSDARAVWAWLEENVRANGLSDEAALTAAEAAAALRAGKTDARSRDILFVRVCRAFLIPARLNPVTGCKEYWADGAFRAIEPDEEVRARLTLTCDQGLNFDEHVSVARLENGIYRALRVEGYLRGARALDLPAGSYRVMTASRQIDGGVLAQTFTARLSPGEAAALPIFRRSDDLGSRLRFAPLPAFTVYPLGGGPALTMPPEKTACLIALIEPGAEPTEHLLNELIALEDRARKAEIILILNDEARANEPRLQALTRLAPDVKLYAGLSPEDERALHGAMGAGDFRLPFALAADAEGRGLCAFANYSVGSAAALLDALTWSGSAR